MKGIVFCGTVHPVDVDVVDGRELDLWFDASTGGVRARSAAPNLVILHHTGGEGSSQTVYSVLRNRKLSIHFHIDHTGRIVQMADIDDVTLHAGSYNGRSVGIEISNAAAPPGSPKRPRIAYVDTVHGRQKRMLKFYPAQCEAAAKLSAALCKLLAIKPVVCTERRMLSSGVLKAYEGVVGHLHLTSKKWDPVGHLLDYVAAKV